MERAPHALVGQGLVGFEEVPARPLLRLESPLVTWRPGLPAPELGPLAWTLEKRWQQPLRPTRVFFAGPAAVRIYGGCMKGHLSNIAQVSHDLHVTEVYLGFLERLNLTSPPPGSARTSSESPGRNSRSNRTRCSTTATANPGSQSTSSGLYGVDKLQAFHTDMERRALPYELW